MDAHSERRMYVTCFYSSYDDMAKFDVLNSLILMILFPLARVESLKIQQGTMKMANFSSPVICIATGTGIAPMRSIIHERCSRSEGMRKGIHSSININID